MSSALALIAMAISIGGGIVTETKADDPNAAFQPDETPAQVSAKEEDVEDVEELIPKGRSLDQITDDICVNATRIFAAQKKLEKEDEIAKESGVVDKYERYRAGRIIVGQRNEAKGLFAEFKKKSGHAFGEKDFKKCTE